MTPRARCAAWRAALSALVAAAAIGVAGCEQLRAIGAMVGLGGDEPATAPSPVPPAQPAATASKPAGVAPGAPPSSAQPAAAPAPPAVATATSQAQPAAETAPKPGSSPKAPVVAANVPATAAAVPPAPALPARDEPFDPAGKRDPFRPYMTSSELAVQRANPQLSPLQKLELSQLRLVAIVWGMRQNHAMVEDPSGVGYVLRVGTKVGPNGGRVSRIAPDAVYVEESFRDATGSALSNLITLRLPEKNRGGKGS